MSDALNKQFIDKGISFIIDNRISVAMSTAKRSVKALPPSVAKFDLNDEESPTSKLTAVTVRPVETGDSKVALPVTAYWLPFEPDKATEIVLGDKADFFFTSQLNGCRVVVSGSVTNPKVVHIDGGLDQKERNALAKPHLGHGARQLSSGHDHGSVPAYDPNPDMEAEFIVEWTTVTGFRKNNTWEVWYQVAHGNGGKRMDKLFP